MLTLACRIQSIEGTPSYDVLTSKFESGHAQTRLRSTTRGGSFAITTPKLSVAEAAYLDNFYAAVYGGFSSFNWTDPRTNTTYTVRFGEDFKIKEDAKDVAGRSVATFTLNIQK